MYTSPIRLLAFDLDGTVLNDQKQLTPRTLAALTAAAERGVALVPATGRTAARFVPENLRAYVLNTRQVVPDLRAFIAGQARGIEKLTVFFLSEDERRRAWAEVAALGVDVVSSLPLNMEVNAAGVDKGAGLLALAGALGLSADALMAIGDGGNDTAMLRAAGLGVAMGNAFPEVKAAADFITADNNADGAARAVERFILGRAGADV